jgi:hypothetical protein
VEVQALQHERAGSIDPDHDHDELQTDTLGASGLFCLPRQRSGCFTPSPPNHLEMTQSRVVRLFNEPGSRRYRRGSKSSSRGIESRI